MIISWYSPAVIMLYAIILHFLAKTHHLNKNVVPYLIYTFLEIVSLILFCVLTAGFFIGKVTLI